MKVAVVCSPNAKRSPMHCPFKPQDDCSAATAHRGTTGLEREFASLQWK